MKASYACFLLISSDFRRNVGYMGRYAFAYLRCSDRTQIEGDTFQRQMAAIDKWLSSNPEYDRLCVYVELGVCGALEDRPALAQMFIDLEDGAVDTVIIEKLDRLARDLMIQENIFREFKRLGVTLISVFEPDLCSDDPTRKMIRVILGAVAEWDRAMISYRTKAARDRIRARGERCEGRKPYGHRPEEKETLNLMVDMYMGGKTPTEICGVLNRAGHKPRDGQFWFPASVRKILRRVSV